MANRIEGLRERTHGFTVTPVQYARVAYVALGALTLIVMTGAAVRLTGSGLGCPTWPRCYGNVYPPLNTHAVIEFSNRMLTAPVSLAALAAWVLSLRRRPRRRDLTWLSALLPLGVLGQAILGGLTVKGDLDYGWVMGHFALSMLILVAAVTLAWRASFAEGDPVAATEAVESPAGSRGADSGGAARLGALPPRPRAQDRSLVWSVRVLTLLGGVTIFAGTAATAAGPHAGGSPGQRINRLNFDGRGTMDFVIHRHGEFALAFGLLAVGVWWLARRRSADALLRRALTATCVLIALQGAVGLDQYETHLPTELVWVHVGLACLCWLSCLWATCAAGALQPRAEPARRPNLEPLAPRNPAA